MRLRQRRAGNVLAGSGALAWCGAHGAPFALAALGGLARVLDGDNARGTRAGVLLDGVEADLVTVGIVQLGQDPADAGEAHPTHWEKEKVFLGGRHEGLGALSEEAVPCLLTLLGPTP